MANKIQEFTLDKIKKQFFSDPTKICELKKGEILMEQAGFNDRLYLILEGRLTAYSDNIFGKSYQVFRARQDMFAGVYSFFSGSYRSLTTIIADKPTKLAYIEALAFEERDDTELMIRFFLPVVLSDLDARMQVAHQMAREKEEAVTQLLKTEKMSMLGQLAAGLAHELNNAVGVLKSKSEWLAISTDQFFKERGDSDLYPFFVKGRNEGQVLSTRDIRQRKNEIADKLGVGNHLAKELARTGCTVKELSKFKDKLDKIDTYWDIGMAFYDMELAARHASAVVQSVKELGAGSVEQTTDLDLIKTIKEALVLLQSVLRQVKVSNEFEESLTTAGSNGELVQVWINLIKNACESMINAKTQHPLLQIIAKKDKKWALVRIIDNGPGIPEDLIDKIFQPNVTTKKGGLSFGLGLGLPITQRIIESHGGKIKVVSQPGKTEFKVKLPI